MCQYCPHRLIKYEKVLHRKLDRLSYSITRDENEGSDKIDLLFGLCKIQGLTLQN
jgi:hypothetical protein